MFYYILTCVVYYLVPHCSTYPLAVSTRYTATPRAPSASRVPSRLTDDGSDEEFLPGWLRLGWLEIS